MSNSPICTSSYRSRSPPSLSPQSVNSKLQNTVNVCRFFHRYSCPGSHSFQYGQFSPRSPRSLLPSSPVFSWSASRTCRKAGWDRDISFAHPLRKSDNPRRSAALLSDQMIFSKQKIFLFSGSRSPQRRLQWRRVYLSSACTLSSSNCPLSIIDSPPRFQCSECFSLLRRAQKSSHICSPGMNGYFPIFPSESQSFRKIFPYVNLSWVGSGCDAG